MALGAVRHGVETAPDTASSLHCTHGARKAHASAAHMTTETHGQTHRMRARLRRRELHVTSRSGGHSQRSTCATSLTAIAIHNGCHQRRLPLTTIAIHTRLISASIERIPERKACLAIKLIDGLALWPVSVAARASSAEGPHIWSTCAPGLMPAFGFGPACTALQICKRPSSCKHRPTSVYVRMYVHVRVHLRARVFLHI